MRYCAPCSNVKCEPFVGRPAYSEEEDADAQIRTGWRVSWEGDGWWYFSRQSSHVDAKSNRAMLEEGAHELGLEVLKETAPSMLVLTPLAEAATVVSVQEDITKVEQRVLTDEELMQIIQNEDTDTDYRPAFLRAMDAEDVSDWLLAEQCWLEASDCAVNSSMRKRFRQFARAAAVRVG
jgi:hypothetical protein